MTAEVSPFGPDYESMHYVHAVDTSIIHDDEDTVKSCMLIVRDALSVSSMDHNLIPPCVMKEVGVNVRTSPKFQKIPRLIIIQCINLRRL